MEEQSLKKDAFNAEAFVETLLTEGANVACDETSTTFQNSSKLPNFYDENLHKKGQKFFYDNIFALFYGKLLGLLCILAIPSIVRLLIFTKMSGSPMTAYRRYLGTIFHMCIWYKSDFTPGSKLWQSIEKVRNKHNSASRRGSSNSLWRISQKDMVLTQFGFMGFALAKREGIGLYHVKDEDLRGFVHIWRVIGSILGIQDRFNICRDSVEETAAICKILIRNVFAPAFERKDKEFIEMATYLMHGMWSMNPTISPEIHMNLAHRLLKVQNNNAESAKFYMKMSFYQTVWYYIGIFTMWSLQFSIFKFYHNHVQYMSLWLMRVCPFLGYYQFGYSNSHVNVLEERDKNH